MKNILAILVVLLFSWFLLSCSPSGNQNAEPPADNGADSARVPGDILQGAWSETQADDILSRTLELHLATDLSQLSVNERLAVEKLIRVGNIFNDLYELSLHPQALELCAGLKSALANAEKNALPEVQHLRKLNRLYYLAKGPITTTLDNQRVPFLAADPERPGKNVYPLDAGKEEIENFFQQFPKMKENLLDLRAVVRRNSPANLQLDLKTLDTYPTLDRLHPGFRGELQKLASSSNITFYPTPYSIAYADRIMQAYDLLNQAAAAMDNEDPAFAQFLRLRGRDLLADNYDGGDAAWVTSQFTGDLNAQIGSYETYNDSLYGVKTFFSLSLLQRDRQRSDELLKAIGGIQAIEDALPYDSHKRIRADIPVGVYNIIADFGQARGANTATILPNEGRLSRQYGRTILIRGNILTNPAQFARGLASFSAAIDPAQKNDLLPEGNLYRTLWHEIGHYLGVDKTVDGGDLDAALQDTADLLEEMKADLVSLFAAPRLAASGLHTPDRLKAIYASGILRVLQKNKPRRDQPYNTMQLIQWNWFLDKGLLTFNPDSKHMHINYDRYDATVSSLLREVLAIQSAGDRDKAESFVQRWTQWDPDLHGVVANAMKANETYRYTMVTYAALDGLQ